MIFIFTLGAASYKIVYVGSQVQKNLRDLGHITLRFISSGVCKYFVTARWLQAACHFRTTASSSCWPSGR